MSLVHATEILIYGSTDKTKLVDLGFSPIQPISDSVKWNCILVSLRAVLLLLLMGCSEAAQRMDHPEDPEGRYRTQIQAAKRLLDQKESWAHRAEWEVRQQGSGWELVAWRVEHPERKGGMRYLPWGYSVIQLDSRNVPVNYRRKG